MVRNENISQHHGNKKESSKGNNVSLVAQIISPPAAGRCHPNPTILSRGKQSFKMNVCFGFHKNASGFFLCMTFQVGREVDRGVAYKTLAEAGQ